MTYFCSLNTPLDPAEAAAPTTALHRAGFVSILGRPNAGKSTLLNAIMGEKVSAVTYKAQTTRHRIFGIYSTDTEQIVFSDTPGMLEANYGLHRSMMRFVHESLEDADLLLLLVDATQPGQAQEALFDILKKTEAPIWLLINKIDEAKHLQIATLREALALRLPIARTFEISALHKTGMEELVPAIIDAMPEHPAFFDKEQLSDKSERFFASEIIREKIFINYQQEIPYSCEVVIEEFKDTPEIIRIRSEIYVERLSQKGILIGKKGEALKVTATQARLEMEQFFGKKVFLETYVRVKEDWRNQKHILRSLGYEN